jgi:hypothetical protein
VQDGIDVLHIDCDGFLLFFALNARDAHVQVTVRTSAKVMSVRCSDGILKDDPALAVQPPFNEQIGDSTRATPPSAGFKFEAKWKVYGASACLPPQSQRLLLVMSPRGYQSHAGRIVFDAGEMVQQPRPTTRQSIRAWLGSASGETSTFDSVPIGIFDALPLDKGFLWETGRRRVDDGLQAAVEQSIVQAAIEQSKAEEQLLREIKYAHEEEEARQLQLALAASQQEDHELQTAIERSRKTGAAALSHIVEILSSDDESDIRVISSRDKPADTGSLFGMGFSKGATASCIPHKLHITFTVSLILVT